MMTPPSTHPPRPAEVLVVDATSDGPRIAAAIVDARPSLGVVVDPTGTEWVERFAVGRPCVVIADRSIGRVDGLSVLSRARRLEPFCARILCTRHPDQEHAIEALRARCDDYVVREGDFLPELVRRVLELVDDGDSSHQHEMGMRTLRDLLDSTPVMVARTSPAGRITYLNPRGREFLGIGTRALGALSAERFYAHPEDRTRLLETLKQVGVAEMRGIEMRSSENSTRWFDVAVRAVRDERNELRSISMIGIETTEREAALREARLNEERYRTLADSIPDLFCVFDAELRCLDWNRAAEKLSGRSAESMLGRTIDEALPNLPGTPSYVLLVRALEQQTVIQVEMKLGLYLDSGVYDVSFVGANGVVGMLARDVTDRIESEARLRAALAEKEVLLQEIHHRVKNNLQVVSSLLNLKLRTIEDAAVREQVVDMQGRVMAMALVHEYLYRSGDLGRLDVREYVTRLVEGTLAVLDRGANIRARLSIEDVSLGLDVAMRLGFVIHELVSNACKHAFPDGRRGNLRLDFHRLAHAPTFYELVVEDDGVGMPPEARSRGTLGLELVERLLSPLHGILRVESHEGTTLTVQFEDRSP